MSRKNTQWWYKEEFEQEKEHKNLKVLWTRIFRTAIATLSLVGITAVTALAVNVIATGQDEELIGKSGNFGELASSHAILARCGPMYSMYERDAHAMAYAGEFSMDDITPNKFGNKVVPILLTRLVPPYGYMDDEQRLPKEQNFYAFDDTYPLTQTLRSMYEGDLIIWYSPIITETELNSIRAWADTQENVRILAWKNENLGLLPDQTAVAMPMNRAISFGMWGATQSCMSWSPEAVEDFVSFAREKREESGIPDTPPKAVITEDGTLRKFPYVY